MKQWTCEKCGARFLGDGCPACTLKAEAALPGSGGPAPTAAEDAAWLLAFTAEAVSTRACFGVDAIRLRAIASRLATLIERLAAAERDGDERVRQVQNAGNGLYLAILKVLTPAFPEGSRDLEWDVLPGAVRQVLKRATAAEAALATRTAEGEALRSALAGAAVTFRLYEAKHRAKGTAEGEAKAQANAEHARACEAALAPKAGGEAGK